MRAIGGGARREEPSKREASARRAKGAPQARSANPERRPPNGDRRPPSSDRRAVAAERRRVAGERAGGTGRSRQPADPDARTAATPAARRPRDPSSSKRAPRSPSEAGRGAGPGYFNDDRPPTGPMRALPDPPVAPDPNARDGRFAAPAEAAVGQSVAAPPREAADALTADLDAVSTDYAPSAGYDSLSDLAGEPTPALLAARAEPLGDPATARQPGRPGARDRSRPSSRAEEAVRASQAKSRAKRKPKDPPKVLVGAAIALVVLAGIGAAYLLITRGNDDTAAVEETQETVAPGGPETIEGEALVDDAGAGLGVTDGSAGETPAADRPTVQFNEAAIGPVASETPYDITASIAPEGASYQLFIDDVPTAEPAAVLPQTTFEPGHHLVKIDIQTAEGTISTDPVVIYALVATPQAGYFANLSSVNIETEGWIEAVNQFDGYVAAGHTEARLTPSAWYPALPAGFWNITVGPFDDAEAAQGYCTQSGLVNAEDCFARFVDPDAPAGG